MDKKAVKATSEKNGPSPHMVNCVLDQTVLDASYLPETLCIDEFKANTDEGKMAIAVADSATGYLVEILLQLTSRRLNGFFGGFSVKERSRVRFYCCDISLMFIRAKKEWFPTALHRPLSCGQAHKRGVQRREEARAKGRGAAVSLRKEIEGAWKLRPRGAPGNKQSHPHVHARPRRRRDSRSCPSQTLRSRRGSGGTSA